MSSTRINKYLTQANYCSRRQADKLIVAKKVRIDNRVAQLGDQVKKGERVFVDGKEIKLSQNKTYLAFHKPVGIICTTDPKSKDNVIDYLHYPERIYPIGRLDVNSSGLILLTNDGTIVNKILKGRHKIEKEYLVGVDKSLTPDFINSLKKGVLMDGYKTMPAEVNRLADKEFSIVLNEGKNRQIRRMCEEFGYNVLKLKRVRIGNIELNGLSVGRYRKLENEEIEKLLNK
ncbi:MAG: 23S rRNA pseudouridine synthase F [Candidatus Kerfeldbacteria bacterium CG_4_10_14_0_8_um_filter_42_10]|uniref:Pseudouridine synthase n=1 Tax=Candidatus Kerfeldbacteria bacterium CG_4_10_14_0_8_um_filter_42_10 TaxID=2014248 RepID=A0A2M7RGW7_9BACT|nr:MAG: 23S rRNA pseudouridine synthase F [Candidatus Kerfeldbacteria bacterium CG_4_10_14_0_8_um_filter_42_10]